MEVTIFLTVAMIVMMLISYSFGRSSARESLDRMADKNYNLRRQNSTLRNRLEYERYNTSVLKAKVSELEETVKELGKSNAKNNSVKNSIHKIVI